MKKSTPYGPVHPRGGLGLHRGQRKLGVLPPQGPIEKPLVLEGIEPGYVV